MELTIAMNCKCVLTRGRSHFSMMQGHGWRLWNDSESSQTRTAKGRWSPVCIFAGAQRGSAIHTNWFNYTISQKPKLDPALFNGQPVPCDLSRSLLFLC